MISKNKKKFINGGVILAISGADGAGKSTMISGLHDLYSSFLDCKVFALGKPQGKYLEFIRSFIRRRDKLQSIDSYSPDKQSSLKDAILACILAILRLRKASVVLKKAREGNMVLVDRWPTKSFGKMDGPKIVNMGTRNFLIKFLFLLEKSIYNRIPPADICFYLEVDIDEARKRNFERVKDGKETDEMIVIRHQNNHETKPITNKLIRFSNNGPYSEMFPLLASNIWSEIVYSKKIYLLMTDLQEWILDEVNNNRNDCVAFEAFGTPGAGKSYFVTALKHKYLKEQLFKISFYR